MTTNFLSVLEKAANTLDLTKAERETIDQEITSRRATLRLFEGKQALARGETTVAVGRFKEANMHLRSPKLSTVILLLRHMPRLVSWAFTVRERFLAKSQRHVLAGIDTPRGMAS
jgi:hypothetical protein